MNTKIEEKIKPEEWETRLKELLAGFAMYIGDETGPDDHQGWIDKFTNLVEQVAKASREEGENKRMMVEGMVALIKFIRNKAREDILKPDMYGQGYYQAIIDMEKYFGLSGEDSYLNPKIK